MAELLSEAIQKDASDVHITVGVPPVFRVNGTLVESSFSRLSPADTKSLIFSFLNDHQVSTFREELELCCSIAFTGGRRFRMSAFHQRGAVAACLRLIPKKVASRESLHLPEAMTTAVQNTHGLVLVTGNSGCGKSTTLNYMIDFLNREKELHIITIENPIEHLHLHQKSMVNQREIGRDTIDNTHALRAALREDVDAIVIAEMGILAETVDQVLEAADTGHLVISTFHTTDAVSTIQGLSELFPFYTSQTKVRLARLTRAIFSQQLVRRVQGGLVPAVEVLIGTLPVKGAIESGQGNKIYNAMQMGRNVGMQTMEQSLFDLVQNGLIDREVALGATIHQKEILRMLDGADL
jgi:twitching motility protein PilT